MQYLGDYASGGTIDFLWSTNDGAGASVTRATNGTVKVYKGNSTTETTTGVTDDEDFDSVTGIHHCRIVTTDVFYETGKDYAVVLTGATIDGKTVNAALAHFSIENRYRVSVPAAGAVADAVWDEALSGHVTAGSAGKALGDAGSVDVDAGDVAVALLKADWSGISGEGSHSMLNAFRFLRNPWEIRGGVIYVYKEDGATVAWSAPVATNDNAAPVVGLGEVS